VVCIRKECFEMNKHLIAALVFVAVLFVVGQFVPADSVSSSFEDFFK